MRPPNLAARATTQFLFGVLCLGAICSRAQQAPQILAGPRDQVVMLGERVAFTVVASGTPPLNYQWQFDSVDILGATASTLLLPSVGAADSGLYTVRAANSAGSALSAPAQLTVIPALPGTLDAAFNPKLGPSDFVRAAVVAPDGKVIIGGAFTQVNGTNRGGIARLNSNGTLDLSFDPGLGVLGTVFALALQNDGKVLVGGAFNVVNGTNRANIARLDSGGGLDTTFNPGSGTDGAVWALGLQSNGQVLLGGDFTSVNQQTRQRIARLHGTGSLDQNFASGLEVNDSLRALAIQSDGRILIGGNFTFINNTPRGRIARLTSAGGLDATFVPSSGADGWVFSLALQPNGQILLGGSFTAINGASRNGLARINSNGDNDAAFDPGAGANNGVSSLVVQPDRRILVGGGFTEIDGQPRHRVARLKEDGSLDLAFEPMPGANNWVEAVALQSDGKIVVVGSFTSINGADRRHIARLHGVDPAPFPPVIAAQPSSQAVNAGVDVTFQVQAFGFPRPSYQWTYNGSLRPGATLPQLILRNVRPADSGNYRVTASNSLGAVTSAVATLTVSPAPTHPGAPDIDFYVGSGPNGTVSAIALLPDRSVLIGGLFGHVNNVPRSSLARLQSDGQLDPSFIPPLGQGSRVFALAVEGSGKILVAGVMTALGDNRPVVVRLTSSGNFDSTFAISFADQPIHTVHSLSNGQTLIGGAFARVNGMLRFGVARLNSDGSLDPAFRPASAGTVYALASLSGGKVLMAGSFAFVGGIPRNNLARLNADGSLDLAFNPGSGPNSVVRALAVQPDGHVLLAGQFTMVNGRRRSRVARLQENGLLDSSFDPGEGPNRNVNALALQPDGKVFIAGSFSAVSGIPRNGVARLNANGSCDVGFTPREGPNDNVLTMALQEDGRILLGCEFTAIDGIPRPGIGRLLGGELPPSAPVIFAQPRSQTVMAGEEVSFDIMASARPSAQYQWQHNGAPLAGADNWLLTIANARLTNAGSYAVRLSNSLGAVLSAPASLTVIPPPRKAGAPDIDFYSGFGPNDRVHVIALQADQKILIGGRFTEVDDLMRHGIARLHRDGRVDSAFEPGSGANRAVWAMTWQEDQRILIAGEFTQVNGTNRNYIARLHANGGLDLSFDSRAGPDGPVAALAVQPDGRILIGGAFNFVSSARHGGVARLHANGELDTTFDPGIGAQGSVKTLALQPDGRVLVGGQFNAVNGLLRNNVARLNNDGSLDTTFDPGAGPNGPVNSLALQPNGGILIGGSFNFVDNTPRLGVARLDSAGSLDADFKTGSGVSNGVNIVVLQRDGKILVGGSFERVNGIPIMGMARLNANGSLDASFDPGAGVTDGTFFFDEYGLLLDRTAVFSIVVEDDDRILIGGDFTKVNGIARNYIARLFEREPSTLIRVRLLPGAGSLAVELIWEAGVLQGSEHLAGPWNDVMGATSPHRVQTGLSQQFFRLRLN